MKTTTAIITITTLLLITTTNTQKCSNNCISCMPQGCYRCKYYMTMNSLQCGKAIDPIIKYCEVMKESEEGLCTQCKETYALSRDRKSCVKTTISNCRIAHVDNEGRERCTACDDSQPNSTNTLCSTDLKI